METSSAHGQTESVNGMQMYCELQGQGEPLVLLHGFTGSSAEWGFIFKEPPTGYRLVIPDLRGHGRSTNPSMAFTHRQSALDVFALLDRLAIDRFKAIGMSTGAKTLLHMATQHPGRLKAMVLVSATTYFPQQARAIMGQMTLENRTDEEWQLMRQRHTQGPSRFGLCGRRAMRSKTATDDTNFTPPYLSTITAHTLIVHGDRDPFYPASIALEMYAAIPGSYLWVIPNGGHIPIFGAVTGQFVETALAFLRGGWGRPS